MNLKRILAAAAAMVLSVSMLAGCGGKKERTENNNQAEGAKTVNIAIQPSAAFIPLYIAREKGWVEEALKEQGVSVVWNDFESGPPMNESLAAGTSDVGLMGDVPTVSALAAGQQNEIIATATDAPDSYAMLVRADSDITSPADLKGKKVGMTVGSAGHILTEKLLQVNNLDINTDIEIVNMAMGDAAAVLANGEVDAVSIWEPNITRLVQDGTAKIIGEGSDCGILGLNPIVARAEYAQNNPEIIKVIIEQYARGVAALKDLDEETKNSVAEALSIEPDLLLTISEKFQYNVRISEEDIASLQDTISFLMKIDVITEEFEVRDYVNTEYVESADIAQYLD